MKIMTFLLILCSVPVVCAQAQELKDTQAFHASQPAGLMEHDAVINWRDDLVARAPLSDGMKVSFGDLPLPVLTAIQSYAGATFISDLERGEQQGQQVYQASFIFNGRPMNLRVLQNGSLVRDQANDLFVAQYRSHLRLPPSPGVGSIPSGESGSGTSDVADPASPGRP